MPGQLDDADRRYLQRAIQISRRALEDDGKTPSAPWSSSTARSPGRAPAAWSSFTTRPRTPK